MKANPNDDDDDDDDNDDDDNDDDDDDDDNDDDLFKASAPPGPRQYCRRCGRWRGGRCGWDHG